MPICLMGCDYFYEKNYVIIEHGFIRKGVEVEDGAEELKIIQELIGNKIDSRWLKGSSSYFKTSR